MSSQSLNLTTLHVRRAVDGDAASVAWIVERFTPALLAQARFRMGRLLAGQVDPEDVVNDAWAVALPRLGGIEMRGGRQTPVLMKFLSTTVLHLVNNLLRRAATRGASAEAAPNSDEGSDALAWVEAERSGVVTVAARRELNALVLDTLEGLSPRERELIVLRGIEQRGNGEVASKLGLAPNTAAVAYRRAMEKLRERLPESVFAELGAD